MEREDRLIMGRANEAFNLGDMEGVLQILQEMSMQDNIHALYLKGEASYNLQKWGDALNYFNRILENNPEDYKSRTYVKMINNILNFYNTDFLNP